MDKSNAPRRWFGHWHASARPQKEDPADLGTAFGLDLSLSELGDEMPAPPSPQRGQASWMQRVVLRRRPAC